MRLSHLSSSSTIRVPSDLYEALRNIRVALETKYQSAAPSLQDLIIVALSRFIQDWENSAEREEMTTALLSNRKAARSRMGKKVFTSRDN
jgi:DNA replication initiation complex subunit (GINS family)